MELEEKNQKKRAYLHSIEIDDLWGHRNISLKFFPDINILVGKNGTGKTTVLDIIADILLLDFESLAKITFGSIRLSFNDPLNDGFWRINIESIKSRKGSVDQGLNIQAFDEKESVKPVAEQTISYQYRPAQPFLGKPVYSGRSLEPVRPAVASFINELASVTWISVHRKSQSPSNNLQVSLDSAVDERIVHINAKFTEFVNEIESEQAKETGAFQKLLLKTLMFSPPVADLSQKRLERLQRIDLDALKQRVNKMLESLDLQDQEERFSDIFVDVMSSLKNLKVDKPNAVDDLLKASYVLQMQEVVGIWAKYNEKRSNLILKKYAIALRLDKFIDDKEAFISDSGRVYFRRNKKFGNSIYPHSLSSGEKQLYILLMETLLSADKPSIFMADEPELSLHILWQEKLIDAMRSLNNNAQLIFATHSPDLVGPYSSRVHDMDSNNTKLVIGDR